MPQSSSRDVLSPNQTERFHKRSNEYIENKIIELGKGDHLDFITHCTLVNCDIRIEQGARFVNIAGSTFYNCRFYTRRELGNLHFSNVILDGCTFLGRYLGCRYGSEVDGQHSVVRGCNFSLVKRAHLCDFLDGAEIETFHFPPWPHITITDLPNSREAWLNLSLPQELKIVQHVIGRMLPLALGVTVYLPAVTAHVEPLRDLFQAQSYIYAQA